MYIRESIRCYQGVGVLWGWDIPRDDVLPIGEGFAEYEVLCLVLPGGKILPGALHNPIGRSVSCGEVPTESIFHQCSQNSKIIIAKVFWYDFFLGGGGIEIVKW